MRLQRTTKKRTDSVVVRVFIQRSKLPLTAKQIRRYLFIDDPSILDGLTDDGVKAISLGELKSLFNLPRLPLRSTRKTVLFYARHSQIATWLNENINHQRYTEQDVAAALPISGQGRQRRRYKCHGLRLKRQVGTEALASVAN